MLQKLFSLIDQTSVPDNPDSLQNQDVLLPGHLITIYLKVENSGILCFVGSFLLECMIATILFFLCIAPVAFCHLSIVRRLKLLTTLVPPQLKKIP